jgi:hypothetical protein
MHMLMLVFHLDLIHSHSIVMPSKSLERVRTKASSCAKHLRGKCSHIFQWEACSLIIDGTLCWRACVLVVP